MGNFSQYLREKILKHGLGAEEFSIPTMYFGLCSESFENFSGVVSELLSPNYSRFVCPVGSVYWRMVNDRQITNKVTIRGDIASDAWDTAVSWAMFDTETPGTGNILMYGDLENNQITVRAGKQALIPHSTYNISFLPGGITNAYTRSWLQALFGLEELSFNENTYVGFSVNKIADIGVVNEPIGNNYTRMKIQEWSVFLDLIDVAGAVSGTNSHVLSFSATPGGWGGLCGAFVANSMEEADILFYNNFDATFSFATGDSGIININGLLIKIL